MNQSPGEIRFFQSPAILRSRTGLKAFLLDLFANEGKVLDSLNYIFCTDKELLKINQQFLQHDDYTDIITFELSPSGGPVTGEIYISVDRVRENARSHNETFSRELHRVIFHGALHLSGFKDKTPAHIRVMRRKEDEYLDLYFK